MGNLTYNRINTVLSEEDILEIKTQLGAIQAKLPAKTLTPQERKSIWGMGSQNKAFVNDCINMLKINGPEIMPAYISLENLVADYELFCQLDDLKSLVQGLMNQIDDAQRIAGKESIDLSISVFKHYKTAAEIGVTGAETAYAKLSKRFSRKDGSKKTDLKK